MLTTISAILNKFISEIRDQKIQKDRLRFRRNLERCGEIFAYEISKELEYKTTEVVTPLGVSEDQSWQHYMEKRSLIKEQDFEKFFALVSSISHEHWDEINELKKIKNYKDLDPSVLMAIYCSRKAFEKTDWKEKEFGVNIGSSRGATSLFEKYFNTVVRTAILVRNQ